MYPILPGQSADGLLEMMCYGFTVVAALFSYLVTLRF